MKWVGKKRTHCLQSLNGLSKEKRGEFTEETRTGNSIGFRERTALRFGGRKAQQRLDLENDSQLEEAIAVLTDINVYKETLARSD